MTEYDMKAIQFFSKENTTRINIAYQKMYSWISKMKKEHGIEDKSHSERVSKKSPKSSLKSIDF